VPPDLPDLAERPDVPAVSDAAAVDRLDEPDRDPCPRARPARRFARRLDGPHVDM
jgi:hypothetical protein